MRQRKIRKRPTQNGILFLALPLAILANVYFFGVVIPPKKAERQHRTATVFLEKAKLDATGLEPLASSSETLFGKERAVWKLPLPPETWPDIGITGLIWQADEDRLNALENLQPEIANVTQKDFDNAFVWMGGTRLGPKTFCYRRTCRITAAQIGSAIYFEIVAM